MPKVVKPKTIKHKVTKKEIEMNNLGGIVEEGEEIGIPVDDVEAPVWVEKAVWDEMTADQRAKLLKH